MSFSMLMGVEFVEAELDRVTASTTVRDDLCTVGGGIHGVSQTPLVL